MKREKKKTLNLKRKREVSLKKRERKKRLKLKRKTKVNLHKK